MAAEQGYRQEKVSHFILELLGKPLGYLKIIRRIFVDVLVLLLLDLDLQLSGEARRVIKLC